MSTCRFAECIFAFVVIVSRVSADEPNIPAVRDADAAIQAQIREKWKSPQRQLWRIIYHPIKGMQNQSAWHIEGTHWWVRIHPESYKLDEFDKTAVYEIDAVALNQNFGV